MVESKLDFEFKGEVVKFDDTKFYTLFKSYQPNGKGVDFILKAKRMFMLLEVKNCKGFEKDNFWRTNVNTINEDGEESFDIEIAKKVEGTLACLVGAGVSDTLEAEQLKPFIEELILHKYEKGKNRIEVVLFLEGDFKTKTNDKKMIMKRIQDKIKIKLRWLSCTVRVVDSESYRSIYYSVKEKPDNCNT